MRFAPRAIFGVAAVAAFAGAALIALHAAGDPASDFRAAIQAVTAKNYAAATPVLSALGKRAPLIADYAAWFLATAQSESKNYAAVPPAVDLIFAQMPRSPLRGRASLLAADAYIKLNQPADAVRVLREHASETTPPQTDMALGDAYLAAGDKANAAVSYQKVYFGYPLSPAAPRALTALLQLQQDLGESYPPESPQMMLRRALKLLDGGQEEAARKELEVVLPRLTGADLDLARVRIGVAMYGNKQDVAASDYLAKLSVDSDDADAERLNYLALAARRLKQLDRMDQFAQRDAELHPKSHWTADALTAAANRHLTDNDVTKYEPLYQSCYENQPVASSADLCHWKVTWVHYLRRDRDAALMLRDHLRMYPASDEASAALYFLGRLAVQSGDVAAARTFFNEVGTEYPNLYYAYISREQLTKIANGPASPSVQEFLHTIAFPQRSRTQDFSVTPEARARIDRAAFLNQAGQKDLAEGELRFGADLGVQPPLLAMELARMLGDGDPGKAMRYIKRYARGYLMTPIPSAPREFWRLAFPLPYRSSLEKYTDQHGVDRYVMAALIRQESEFDVQAVSVTGARGLSQIQPTTGRDLAKRLGISFSATRLFQPDYNLQLGTYYFSWLTKQLNGNVEAALASYNAGMTRAKQWLAWGEFREPAEFIETIPLTQTRDYVQAVERNAAAYREIYATTPPQTAAQ